MNARDFNFISNTSNLNGSGSSSELFVKLRSEFNICVRNWTLYMLDITRSRGDDYNMKKLQMVLNINSFDFEAETNKFNGILKLKQSLGLLNFILVQICFKVE